MSYQKTEIIGRLGRDPEMRFTPNGQAVTSFSVATDRTFTQNGEKVKETIWFRVSAWGNQAEACNTYLKKGKKVFVEGRLTADGKTGGPRIWSGQDGEARASFEISASNVIFLSDKNEGEQGGEFEPGANPNDEPEIPF